MARFLKTKSLYYDDVNLIASKGCVTSRKEVPLERHRIVVAPMAAIVGETFVKAAVSCGVTVILHRFCDIEKQVDLYKSVRDQSPHLWCAVGLKEPRRVEELVAAGCRNFLLDVANGYSDSTLRFLREFVDTYPIERMMAGNIHTSAGYNLLEQAMRKQGIHNFIRVGIGNGAACLTTKEATGFGRGQISELLECYEYKNEISSPCSIVADGGIRSPADASKAFGAGAEYVMMGSFFARAQEAETHCMGDGTYWGGASYKQQQLYGGIRRHAEGTVLKITDELLPLHELVDTLWMSLASAVSYSGKPSLEHFIGEGVFEIKYQ